MSPPKRSFDVTTIVDVPGNVNLPIESRRGSVALSVLVVVSVNRDENGVLWSSDSVTSPSLFGSFRDTDTSALTASDPLTIAAVIGPTFTTALRSPVDSPSSDSPADRVAP